MQRGNAECAVSSERYIPHPLLSPCQKRSEPITFGEIKVTRLESIALMSHGEMPKPRPNRGAIMLVGTRDPAMDKASGCGCCYRNLGESAWTLRAGNLKQRKLTLKPPKSFSRRLRPQMEPMHSV